MFPIDHDGSSNLEQDDVMANDPHERVPDACSLVDTDALDDTTEATLNLGWDRGGSHEAQDEIKGNTAVSPSAPESLTLQVNLLYHQLPYVIEQALHPKGWRAGGEQQHLPATPGIYRVVIPFRFCTGGWLCTPSLHHHQELLATEPLDDLGDWAIFQLAYAPSLL